MHSRAVRLLACLAAAGALLGAGCQSGVPPNSAPRIEFLEANAVPVPIVSSPSPRADGGVVTITVAGINQAVTVTNVGFASDPGLMATYLGWTDCHKGCAGTGLADPAGLAFARHSLDGTTPVTLPREFDPNSKRLSFVVVLRVASSSLSRLEAGCLYVRSARLTLADGSVETVTAPGGQWIAAILWADAPATYHPC